MQRGKFPYRLLGSRLSEIRKKSLETIHEVSGAVELESDEITRFEAGEKRPSEDILSLLIDHFDIKDEDADELWELAGYSASAASVDLPQMPTLVVVPNDTRIIYTDTANVTVNNFGVVMNFMQNGANNQPLSIARIGMSLDHAKSVLEVLGKTIAQAEAAKTPKSLPSGIVKETSNKKSRNK